MNSNLPKQQNNKCETKKLLFNNNRPHYKIKKLKSRRAKSVINERKEKGWDNRFIYNNDQKSFLSRDTSGLNIKNNKTKSIFTQNKEKCSNFYFNFLKKFTNDMKKIENNKTTHQKNNNNYNNINKNNLNRKFSPNQFKIFSAKYRATPSFINNNKNIYNNHTYFTSNCNNNNLLIGEYDGNNNKINELINIWGELCVLNSYKKYFYHIFKELDENDQNEIYISEKKELFDMKNNIKILCYYIDLRMGIINKLYILNQKLNTEYVNNSIKNNENIINSLIDQIAIEIEKLREVTINVISSMRKLKNDINNIEYLGKYNIDALSQKYKFDKNYILKMKNETNFLKEGCASIFFNLKDEQSPFLLKTANYPENQKNSENSENIRKNIKIIPINECLINEIKYCNYYIYQELIAYQNEKMSKNIFRCISPIKKYRNINYEFNDDTQKDFERKLSNGLMDEKNNNQDENIKEEEIKKEKNYEEEKNNEKNKEEEKTTVVNFPIIKNNIKKNNDLKLTKEDNNLNSKIKEDRLPSFAPIEEKRDEKKEKIINNRENKIEPIKNENNIKNNIKNNFENNFENNIENNFESNIENNFEDDDLVQQPLNSIFKQTNNKKKEDNYFIANLFGKHE